MPQRRRPGIGVYLLAVALVPLVASCALAWQQSTERRDVTARAEALGRAVERIPALAEARVAASQEVIVTGIALVGPSIGLPVEVVGEFLGVDVTAELVEARRAVDALPPELAPLLEDLVGLRAGVDVGTISQLDHAERSADTLYAIDERLETLSVDLRRQADDFIGAGALVAALDDVQRTVPLLGITPAQIQHAFTALQPRSDEDRLAASARLLALQRQFDDVAAAIERPAGLRPALLAEWRSYRADPDVRRFEEVVAALTAPLTTTGRAVTPATSDVSELAEIFASALTRVDRTAGLLVAAAVEADRQAEALVADLQAVEERFVLVAGTLLSVSIAAVVLVSQAITVPLRRLAASAAALRSGDLDADLARPGGPRQVLLVGRAVEELAGTLRVVQDQAEALAAGRVDDPSFSAPVPGRLGEAVQASLLQLSTAIAEQRQLRDVLTYAAGHDALTGLANRGEALHALGRELARGSRAGTATAALFCDLDGFKRVNDDHGHPVGDEVLCEVAERLVGAVRAGDVVARFGGDEFVVVAGGFTDPAEAAELGRRLLAVCERPFPSSAGPAAVGMSIGLAIEQDGGQDPAELVRRADIAAAKAKRAGRGRMELFDERLRQQLAEADDLRVALRRAIAEGELDLHHQPVVDAVTGEVVGLEGLVRWHRPGFGPVPPAAFVPVAERSELVIELDRWVLERAAEHLAAWRDHPVLGRVTLAVNLSARHLGLDAFAQDVLAPLARHAVEPGRLCVEVTESVMVGDLERATDRLAHVRAAGVKVAVDDFGTGFTSIANLRQMPVDVLKIDRSIVGSTTEGDRSILALLATVGTTLGLVVVAEGVEHDGDVRRAREAGCARLQGWAFAKAMPAAELETFVSALPGGRFPLPTPSSAPGAHP